MKSKNKGKKNFKQSSDLIKIGLDKNIKDTKKIKKKRSSSIPKEVANRMARRIAITTGLPTLCGMGVFVFSYYLITNGISDVPPVITLVSSGAFFLLGIIGLSYGILSSSWDKGSGTILGIENIKPNIKRVKEAFRTEDIN